MMKNALYGGINAAVLTAMNEDLSVDLDRMAAHAKWLLANGCNGLGVLGTTGEANSLGVSERMDLLEGLVKRGIPAAKMMPGTGTPALPDTVALTKKAKEIGCPGVLVLPPFFYKGPSDDGLFAYFSELVARTKGETAIYLYHFPQQSAVPFSLDLLDRLITAFPGVIRGMKDSSGDLANQLAVLERFAPRGFELYTGGDDLLQTVLKKGAAGCITAAANINCGSGRVVYANPDAPAADAAHLVLAATRKAVTKFNLIASLKAVVARNTGNAAWNNIRPPHLKLTEAEQAELLAAIDASGVQLAKAA